MIKKLTLLFVLFYSNMLSAQPKYYYDLELARLSFSSGVPANTAVIYGDFFRRDMKGSAVAAQDVTLKNKRSGVVYKMVVKPVFNSRKNTIFCFRIPTGTYTLVEYKWMQRPPGAISNYENISFNKQLYEDYRGYDSVSLYGSYKHVFDTTQMLTPFTFSVDSAGLYYVGEWHFESDTIHFKDNKEVTDKRLINTYPALKYPSAKAVKSTPVGLH